jgi:hypothetical protein
MMEGTEQLTLKCGCIISYTIFESWDSGEMGWSSYFEMNECVDDEMGEAAPHMVTPCDKHGGGKDGSSQG